MIICIVTIAVSEFLLSNDVRNRLHPVFWMESLALFAFGFSWVTKAEMVFGDGNQK